jgi:DNA helicase-2/ATP-dependent DNA helicase PcrA
MLMTASVSYLDTLNPEQRRAVEHGVSLDGHVGAPLLVIAGAGSGKTNTLAHRVAHLIVSGADPRRILLMTVCCVSMLIRSVSILRSRSTIERTPPTS